MGKLILCQRQERGQRAGLQIGLKVCLSSASLFWGQGTVLHILNINCISNLWLFLLMEKGDGMIIQNSTSSKLSIFDLAVHYNKTPCIQSN